ncbi:MAG: hypothetical protein JXA33_08625 [Anaerolineae bacterium]|nr:hypothetical protein [Anaerolineae bacterium]
MGLDQFKYMEQSSADITGNLFFIQEAQPDDLSNKTLERWMSTVLALTPHSGKASSQPLSPWAELALSVVHQSLQDAAAGDYDALWWLVTEGRIWLMELDISPWIVDKWGTNLVD